MKLAVTFKDEEVFQHFGHSEMFKIYEIQDNKIVNTEILDSNGEGHGALSTLLKVNDVETLIAGNIGWGAREALKNLGIKLYPGVVGNADIAVQKFLDGTLEYNDNVQCNHAHGHEHHCGADKHGCSGN